MWDLPTRLFHWALVALIAGAWWSAEQRLLEWHRYCGYGLLTLLLFRLAWGLFGSTTAQFNYFLRGPVRVLAYCRRELWAREKQSQQPGHNPLGGWSVLAMLALALLQILLGLFAVDIDGIESGPLAYLISFDGGRLAAQTHHLVFKVLLSFIGLHIAAIAFYRIHKKENLVSAMISGSETNRDREPLAVHFAPLWRAAALFSLSAAAVFISLHFFGR
ncbi:MAG TPA: cytochrome b/b6 domain-containing protein [Spongiibacteraceae bacterium]|nr:cytochrome b/b6 domain-containing protein [Spongiibacteraceae bacterium]